MQLIEVTEPADALYVCPIGDLHVGDKAFGKVGLKKFLGYRDWILENPNAITFLMGDILNVASRSSKTNPFESDKDEYQRAIDLFKPLADNGKIIGAITGNHERRMENEFGFNPMMAFSRELGIPYLGLSAVVRFKVGARDGRRFHQIYHGYFHHGNGGGGTLGSALNAKVKLANIVEGMDFYASGHDHQLVTGQKVVFTPAPGRLAVDIKKITYVDTGSFLDYAESYAEAMAMSPGKLGSPRIRLSGIRDKHDVHVSL